MGGASVPGAERRRHPDSLPHEEVSCGIVAPMIGACQLWQRRVETLSGRRLIEQQVRPRCRGNGDRQSPQLGRAQVRDQQRWILMTLDESGLLPSKQWHRFVDSGSGSGAPEGASEALQAVVGGEGARRAAPLLRRAGTGRREAGVRTRVLHARRLGLRARASRVVHRCLRRHDAPPAAVHSLAPTCLNAQRRREGASAHVDEGMRNRAYVHGCSF